MFDEPQVMDAVKDGLIVEYPAAKSPNFKELMPQFQDKWGPKTTLQVIGIGYNPKKIKTPPKSWDALWDPQYKGRVGLTALNSQLGVAFLAEINRIKGGTEEDFEPAFKALRELLPNVGAIAPDLGAFATLWQQEQIDIAPYNFNFVQTLKAKDVPVEFAIPQTGACGFQTSLHLVANATDPDLAVKYIDLHIDPKIQTEALKSPYDAIPTNAKVPFSGPLAATVAKSHEELAKMKGFDWTKINPQRGALIDRFNREIKDDLAVIPGRPDGLARNEPLGVPVKSDESPLVLPLAAMFVACFVAPLCVLIALSLSKDANIASFTAANYAKFFGDSFNYAILFETLLLGVKATLVCLIFGYPIAWICARCGARLQSIIVFLVILPILTSVVVRTFGWIVILGRQGIINQVWTSFGFEPLRLLYTEIGVVMVLAQVQMPLMVLPILTVLSRMDPNLADASRVLGAGEWRTLFRVTFPLSLPGVIAGCILVYTACITAFVTQSLIGGARLIYMPLDIYQQAVGANNWPFAAAISIIFMVAVLIIVGVLNAVGRRSETYGRA